MYQNDAWSFLHFYAFGATLFSLKFYSIHLDQNIAKCVATAFQRPVRIPKQQLFNDWIMTRRPPLGAVTPQTLLETTLGQGVIEDI